MFRSSLYGWVTILAFYSALGFSFFCAGLCYFFGYRENSLVRCVVTSVLLLVVFVCLRLTRLAEPIVATFGTPVMTFGSIAMFLGLLIISSFYNHDMKKTSFVVRQALIISALLIELFIGTVYNIESLTNTSITFLCFYLLEKWFELHSMQNWNIWVFFFLFSIVLWRVALYLHVHPQFIASLFIVP